MASRGKPGRGRGRIERGRAEIDHGRGQDLVLALSQKCTKG